MKHVICFWAIALGILVLPCGGLQANDPPKGLYVIYDSSNSMWAEMPDGGRRYETARDVLQKFLTQDFGVRDIALRVYGHRRADDCSDTELVLPFGPAAGREDQISALVTALRPKGRTPIDLSLRQALTDFGTRSGDILLISDGIESCNADPCALMREWREKNIAVQVHVVGFGVSEKEKASLQCIAAAAGTDFFEANSAAELTAGLSEVQQRSADTVFRLKADDAQDNSMRASGMLRGECEEDL